MAKQHDINSSSITSTKSTASSSDASTEVCGSRPLETSIKSMEMKMVRICRWWGWWEWREHEAGWLGKCFKMNNTSSMPFAKKKKVCFLSPGKNTQKTNTQKNTVGMKYIKMHFKLRYNIYKKNKTTCDNFLKYVNTLDACVLFFVLWKIIDAVISARVTKTQNSQWLQRFSMQLMNELCAGGQIKALSIK